MNMSTMSRRSGEQEPEPEQTEEEEQMIQVLTWDDSSSTTKFYHILDRTGVSDDFEEPHQIVLVRYAVLSVSMVLNFLIALMVMLSSLPSQSQSRQPWQGLLLFFSIIFIVDWIARFLCAPSRLRFFYNLLNVLDLITILPFIVYAIADQPAKGIVYTLLTLRVAHIAHGLLHLHDYDIIIGTAAESSEVAALMILIMGCGMPLGGNLMHIAERGTWNGTAEEWYRKCEPPATCETERSPFQNAFDGMWYFLVSSTTLGYGDMYPTSRTGQIIGGCIMAVGVLMIAYPIMILAVNFEEERRKQERERTLGSVANGERLRTLQRANTNVLQDEEALLFERPLPLYFYPKEINVPRALVMVSETDVRYDPLFLIQRNRDGTLFMLQAVKSTLEVSLRLQFDSLSTQALALEAMKHFQTEDGEIAIRNARFFPVVRLYLSLDIPTNKCEFLSHLRLGRQVFDDIDLDVMRMDIPLELEGYSAELDDQKKMDFHQSLHRCRLQLTAAVAYEDPVYYEVPVYQGILSATSFMRELLVKRLNVVYCTTHQVEQLLNGIHHLLDLGTSEPTIVINAAEVRQAVSQSIILRGSTKCDDPDALKDEQFLYGSRLRGEETYHGVFVKRLTRDPDSILCNVKVLAVQPRHHSVSIVL